MQINNTLNSEKMTWTITIDLHILTNINRK